MPSKTGFVGQEKVARYGICLVTPIQNRRTIIFHASTWPIRIKSPDPGVNDPESEVAIKRSHRTDGLRLAHTIRYMYKQSTNTVFFSIPKRLKSEVKPFVECRVQESSSAICILTELIERLLAFSAQSACTTCTHTWVHCLQRIKK